MSTYLFRSVSYAGGGVAMMGFRLLQIGGALVGLAVYVTNLGQMRQLRAEAAFAGTGGSIANAEVDADGGLAVTSIVGSSNMVTINWAPAAWGWARR